MASSSKSTSSDRWTREFERALLAERSVLIAFAHSLCGNAAHAEDLVQTTFFKALAGYKGFIKGSNLRAWLYTILRNTYFSEYRHRKHERPLDGVTIITIPDPSGVDLAEEIEWADTLKNTLLQIARLPPQQRDTLVALTYLELPYEKCAQLLSLAVGTVKSRVQRARQTLSHPSVIGQAKMLDLRRLKKATNEWPQGHTLHALAKAYEELYAGFPDKIGEEESDVEMQGEVYVESQVEVEWEKLVATGALDSDDEYGSSMYDDE